MNGECTYLENPLPDYLQSSRVLSFLHSFVYKSSLANWNFTTIDNRWRSFIFIFERRNVYVFLMSAMTLSFINLKKERLIFWKYLNHF